MPGRSLLGVLLGCLGLMSCISAIMTAIDNNTNLIFFIVLLRFIYTNIALVNRYDDRHVDERGKIAPKRE